MKNLLLDSAEHELNPLKKLAKEILEAFELREKACADENWDEENTQMVEIKDHAVDLAGMILDVQPSQAKYIESVTTDKVELEIYECSCGFHLGIDATYIDQVDDCSFVCPSCGETISTEENDNDSGGKMKFSTIEDGVKTIHEACDKAEISEGEFADYLILNYDECFDSSIEPVVVIQAIQKFRQWDYETEDDAIECFGGTEALSENGFYGFIFKRDGISRQLPDGIRIGILKEDGAIELDEGITACFKKEGNEQKPIKRVQCDSCDSAYFDFVLTDENISANPMYICTTCSNDMKAKNMAIEKCNNKSLLIIFSNQEIEKAHKDFDDFKKVNEIIDCGNL